MISLAEAFDSPLNSDRHRALADDGWMGGPGISGRYFLGMLVRHNFFRDDDFVFAQALHRYFHEQGYALATVAYNNEAWDSLVVLLKHEYERSQDIEPSENHRLIAALKEVLTNADASNDELAKLANTTKKQVAKMSTVFMIRRAWKFLDRSKLYQQYLGKFDT